MRSALKKNGKNLGEEIVATSYRNSIEKENLEMFFAAGWIESPSIAERTESQNKTFIEESCEGKMTVKEWYLVDNAVRSVSMQLHISQPEGWIRSLQRLYSQALETAENWNSVSKKA